MTEREANIPTSSTGLPTAWWLEQLMDIKGALREIAAGQALNRATAMERFDQIERSLGHHISMVAHGMDTRIDRAEDQLRAELRGLEQRMTQPTPSTTLTGLLRSAAFSALERIPWLRVLALGLALALGAIGHLLPQEVRELALWLSGSN